MGLGRLEAGARVLRESGTSRQLHLAASYPSTSSSTAPRSLLQAQLKARQALVFSRLRSFYTAPARSHPRPTDSLRHPRWINTRKGEEELEDAQHEQEQVDEDATAEAENDVVDGEQANAKHQRDAKADGTGEGDGRGASSSSVSPPEGPSAPNGNSGSQSGQSPPPPGSSSGSSNSSGSSTQISRQSVPESYPQVLALPIARRPLFPGFYKAVVVRNPGVVRAIKDMMARGQPYLGAFLLKDENTDSDIITDKDAVHPVGVFAQITSVFAAAGKEGESEGLTAVLYPHRRIRLTELVKAGAGSASTGSVVNVEEGLDGMPLPPIAPNTTAAEQSSEVTRQSSGTSYVSRPLLHSLKVRLRHSRPNGFPALSRHLARQR